MKKSEKKQYLKAVDKDTATFQAVQRVFESLDINNMNEEEVINILYDTAIKERETIAKNEKELQKGLHRLQEWNSGTRRRFKSR